MEKKRFTRWAIPILAVVSLTLALSCSESPSSPDTGNLRKSISLLTKPAGLSTEAAKSIEDTPLEDPVDQTPETGEILGAPVTYKVTTQRYSASASYDTQVLLNPSSDVIYPGSVLLGHTIDDGSYQEVMTGTKRPVTVSFDLTGVTGRTGGPGVVSGTITPTLSSYREFRNGILAQSIPKQTSTYSYEMIEINDKTEMDLKIRAGATYRGGAIEESIKAGFEYSNSNVKKKVMVRFMQTFYTVDIDQGNGTFLYQDIDLADFEGYRPVYVASVGYGRLAYLTIESESDLSTIKGNLDAAFKAVTTGINASVETAMTFFKEQTKTNITVIGGTDVATTLDSFMAMLANDTFSEDNAGKIIAYKLRFVDDNSIANTVFNGEYTVRSVEIVQGLGIDVSLRVAAINCQIDDGDSTAEPYGDIVFKRGPREENLWSYGKNSYYTCKLGSVQTYDGTARTIRFAKNTESITIEIRNFGESDTFADDEFMPATYTFNVAEAAGMSSFNVRTYGKTGTSSEGEWIEFNIQPTVTPVYN